jgi:hypothetical protein
MGNSQENIEKILTHSPFDLSECEKKKVFSDAMYEAFIHHYNNNQLFQNFCANNGFSLDARPEKLSDYPYLPVNIFKNKKLSSIPEDQITGILNSSATSGVPSSITLDVLTTKRQSLVSAKIMSSYLGNKRRPLFILDSDPLKSRSFEISARAAASRGFLILANKMEYFLKETDELLSFNTEKFESEIEKLNVSDDEISVFGFTFILYQNVVKPLKDKGITFKLPKNSKIAHIGGWKKLESQKVSKEQFLTDVSQVLGVKKENIFDFYGFTEQMGLVYVSKGNLPKLTPVYSEIIIRDFQTLEPVEDGKEGLIQILTPIPHSYPGISVLTEDVGRILGHGKDSTGRIGTQFEIIGRAKEAETRGCGDIMSEYIS